MTKENFKHLGKSVGGGEFHGLETFPLAWPDGKSDVVVRLDKITIETQELTALCFVTSQPDIYTARVEYIPDSALALETKSVKKYFDTFRTEKISAEDLAQKLAYDFSSALRGVKVTVELKQNIRGGLALTTKATADLTVFVNYGEE